MNKIWRRVASFLGFRYALNGEHGLTLLEILVALGILAAASTIFLYGMTVSSQAVLLSHERVSAESLAKSELEYVKMAPYHSANITWSYQLPSNPPSWDATHSLPDGYDGYTMNVEGDKVTGHISDDGIQQIKVEVIHDGETVFRLIGYKVDR